MKNPEKIHAEYNLLSRFINVGETDGEYTNSLFEQLNEVLGDNFPSKFYKDLAAARTCIDTLSGTIQLVMGWLELEAKEAQRDFIHPKN